MSNEYEEYLNLPRPVDLGTYVDEWVRTSSDTPSIEVGKILLDSTLHEKGDIALRRVKEPDAYPMVVKRDVYQALVAAIKRGELGLDAELPDDSGERPD